MKYNNTTYYILGKPRSRRTRLVPSSVRRSFMIRRQRRPPSTLTSSSGRGTAVWRESEVN